MTSDGSNGKWTYVLDEPTRILVVDDDPILREFASVYLSTPVAQVVAVDSGQAALDLLASESFDICVFDIEMPGMDGFTLVERVRADERFRRLPIVMLTGREDIASIDRAYAAGATSFATKPVNWRLLSYQLRYVIRANRMDPPFGLAESTREIVDAAHQMAALSATDMQLARAHALIAMAEELLRKIPGTMRGIEANGRMQPARDGSALPHVGHVA
jgi:CheY-like chemotaxis protein